MLFVISRYFDTWRVFRFKGKKRDFYFNLGELQFTEKDGEDYFKGKIENIKIYQSGDKFLISVAYYHGMRLKYRKVYVFSVEDSKINKEGLAAVLLVLGLVLMDGAFAFIGQLQSVSILMIKLE